MPPSVHASVRPCVPQRQRQRREPARACPSRCVLPIVVALVASARHELERRTSLSARASQAAGTRGQYSSGRHARPSVDQWFNPRHPSNAALHSDLRRRAGTLPFTASLLGAAWRTMKVRESHTEGDRKHGESLLASAGRASHSSRRQHAGPTRNGISKHSVEQRWWSGNAVHAMRQRPILTTTSSRARELVQWRLLHPACRHRRPCCCCCCSLPRLEELLARLHCR